MGLQRLASQLLNQRACRFLLIGIWNTLFGYGLFLLLYQLLGQELHYLLLAILSHFLAVAQAFIGHRFWVFRSSAPWAGEFLRFNLSYLGTLALGSLCLSVLVELLGFSPPLAQGLAILITVFSSYFLHRHFSFRT